MSAAGARIPRLGLDAPHFMSWEPPPWDIEPDMHHGRTEAHVWQAGRCGICGRHEDGASRRHALDHDHDTGLVRGLLCTSCNLQEGLAPEGPFRLWRNGVNPCAAYGWHYLWRWNRAPLPLDAKEVATRRLAAILREEREQEEAHEAMSLVDLSFLDRTPAPVATTTAPGANTDDGAAPYHSRRPV